MTEDGKKALVTLSNGDMRKVLNVLQVSGEKGMENTILGNGHQQMVYRYTPVVNYEWSVLKDFKKNIQRSQA